MPIKAIRILTMGRLIFLMLFCLSAQTKEITGDPRIIEGNSVRIADVEIRLHGIDAQEGQQLCIAEGEDWACGQPLAGA
jgi:endonuclease YncB( thermonuclease family)